MDDSFLSGQRVSILCLLRRYCVSRDKMVSPSKNRLFIDAACLGGFKVRIHEAFNGGALRRAGQVGSVRVQGVL
jgi:hypothetical protein